MVRFLSFEIDTKKLKSDGMFLWMLKQPGLKLSGLHISVIKYKFRSYDHNISPKFKKKTSFVILGA